MTPLIGSEEIVYCVQLDASFFGAGLILMPCEGGIIPIQPRVWYEPIEDEV